MAVSASLPAQRTSAVKMKTTLRCFVMAGATAICQACCPATEQPSRGGLHDQGLPLNSHLHPYRIVPSPEEKAVIHDYLILSRRVPKDMLSSWGAAYRIRTREGPEAGSILVIHDRIDPEHGWEVGLTVIGTHADQPLGPTWWSSTYWSVTLPDFEPLGVVDLNDDGRDDLVYCWWDSPEGKAHTRVFLQQGSGWVDVAVDRQMVMPVDLSGLRDISTLMYSGLNPYRTYCHDVGPYQP